MHIPKGIILIDKPTGITSFGVVRVLRKRLGVRKMGHAGTLDPLATGLLIIGIDGATKLLKDFLHLKKEYETEIILGVQTATGDREGKVIATARARGISEGYLREVVEGMVGTWHLSVPAYSAVKVGGRRLYESARRGDTVVSPVKPMTVLRAEYKRMREEGDSVVLSATLEVSSGTYIRSLAEEVGRRLGIPASVYSLRRTKVGEFSISDAEPLGNE